MTRTYRSRSPNLGRPRFTYRNALALCRPLGGAEGRAERAQVPPGRDEFLRREGRDPELRGELPRVGHERGREREDFVPEPLGPRIVKARGQRPAPEHRADVVGEERHAVPGGIRAELPARRQPGGQLVLGDIVHGLEGPGLGPVPADEGGRGGPPAIAHHREVLGPLAEEVALLGGKAERDVPQSVYGARMWRSWRPIPVLCPDEDTAQSAAIPGMIRRC